MGIQNLVIILKKLPSIPMHAVCKQMMYKRKFSSFQHAYFFALSRCEG